MGPRNASSRAAYCCCAAALLTALAIQLFRWALPRIIFAGVQPPASQARWAVRHPPSIYANNVRGTGAPSFTTDRRISDLDNFTHRDGDVWVTTYPKVGTTWTQYIVAQLLGYPVVTDTLGLFKQAPWPEVELGVLATPMETLQASATGNRTRVFKSHWPRADYMAHLPSTSKVIYVYRDVERVAHSFYHHVLDKFMMHFVEPEDMPWDTFFEKFIDGDLYYGDYFEHLASWWEARGADNVMLLRYEELKADPHAAVRRIAAFVGAEVDDARVDEVVDATSLKSMKRWSEGFVDKVFAFTGCTRGEHIRNGGHKKEELLTAAQRGRLVARFDAVLRPLGVPFDHLFAQ